MPSHARGRGGRGRGRGRGGRRNAGGDRPRRPKDEWGVEAEGQGSSDDLTCDLMTLFTSNCSFQQHHAAQEKDKIRYAAVMAVLEKNGVEFPQGSRIRALAAAWARHDHTLANTFLQDSSKFGLVKILKALTLLDSGRKVRECEKKLKRLELQPGKTKKKTTGKVKSNKDSFSAIKPPLGSMSGALARHIRRWVSRLTADQLEFYALFFPPEPWKRLADLCHFNPKKDFKLPWFLPYCFGGEAPAGSMVRNCGHLTKENVNELVMTFDIPYAHIKPHKDSLTTEAKARIAQYTTDLDTLLWNYEDLACPATDKVIHDLLTSGSKVNLPYGKLMERLLTLKMMRKDSPRHAEDDWSSPDTNNDQQEGGGGSTDAREKASFFDLLIPLAEKRLHEISVPLEPPVVVIGDASSSMGVAIRTSTIIASLLTAITSAKLVFFNGSNFEPDVLPETIPQVLDVATTVQASGCTAPAASLQPFYDRKEVVKTFIIVTDEEENTNSQGGYRFAPLFKKYSEEVYPAKMVFVSFLRGQHAEGQMVRELKQQNFDPLQFKLDSSRPDLTKLDNLLGLLSMGSQSFDAQVTEMEEVLTQKGLEAIHIQNQD
ncbi:PREDICTED: uncharacterized protein LOC109469324 isoform X1 [Branchiostoma belcheri]|uniref:Uncharacterized protein LOC109469324 isoform X1 n=1 Tax=Branchiostoma belcheri TaxID=7741 RepID=A0A6P4YG16_BRABE|nr:PREDICTED: uncharacterized protein LOC109469324 isoform X1 [Branchiostoma belcheri]